jgi:hypothetical protein
MKEIGWSDHAKPKLEIFVRHNLTVSAEFIIEAIRFPNRLKPG